MNAFEKFDADRALRRKHSIPAWTQFRSALSDCLDSYGRMEEGREYPAEIVENEEKNFITVNCKRHSTSGNGLVSVTAKMTTGDKKIAILAFIETWLLSDDKLSNQNTREYEFFIEADEPLRLSFDGRQVTPRQPRLS